MLRNSMDIDIALDIGYWILDIDVIHEIYTHVYVHIYIYVCIYIYTYIIYTHEM